MQTNQASDEPRVLFSVARRLAVVLALAATFAVATATTVLLYFRGTTIQVPSVVGKSRSEAEQLLRDKALNMKVVAEDYHEKVPAGAVFDQDPKPDTTAKEGSAVDVKISSGKRRPS